MIKQVPRSTKGPAALCRMDNVNDLPGASRLRFGSNLKSQMYSMQNYVVFVEMKGNVALQAFMVDLHC